MANLHTRSSRPSCAFLNPLSRCPCWFASVVKPKPKYPSRSVVMFLNVPSPGYKPSITSSRPVWVRSTRSPRPRMPAGITAERDGYNRTPEAHRECGNHLGGLAESPTRNCPAGCQPRSGTWNGCSAVVAIYCRFSFESRSYTMVSWPDASVFTMRLTSFGKRPGLTRYGLRRGYF